MDAYNVRRGNPDILPQFINSFEFGYQKSFNKDFISLEGYYRNTENKIERIRTVYDENIMLHTFENVGEDYMTGVEISLQKNLFSFWNLYLMGNLFDYRVEGELLGQSFNQSSFNWNVRFNQTFKFSKKFQVQFNLNYNSESVSAQGKRDGFFTSNAAVKYSFFNRKVSLILQVRDLLKTAKYEFISQGENFYNYSHFTRESPVIILSIKINLNNFKEKRNQNIQDENGEGNWEG